MDMFENATNIACAVMAVWFAGAVCYLVVMIALALISNAISATFKCESALTAAIGVQMDRFGYDANALTVAAVWFIAVPFHILWTITDTIKALRAKKPSEPYQGCA